MLTRLNALRPSATRLHMVSLLAGSRFVKRQWIIDFRLILSYPDSPRPPFSL